MFPYRMNRLGQFSFPAKAAPATVKKAGAAKRPARSEPEPAHPVTDFSALRRAADRRRAESPAVVTAEDRAENFAAQMERTLAIVENRKPRKLDYSSPTQHAARGMNDDEINEFFERRDATRAAPRHDRVI